MLSLISVRDGGLPSRRRGRGARGGLGTAAASLLALLLAAPAAQGVSIHSFAGFPSFGNGDRGGEPSDTARRSWNSLLVLAAYARDRDSRFPEGVSLAHGEKSWKGHWKHGWKHGHSEWTWRIGKRFERRHGHKHWRKPKHPDEPGAPIPEPGGALLFAAGAGAVALRLRRR